MHMDCVIDIRESTLSSSMSPLSRNTIESMHYFGRMYLRLNGKSCRLLAAVNGEEGVKGGANQCETEDAPDRAANKGSCIDFPQIMSSRRNTLRCSGSCRAYCGGASIISGWGRKWGSRHLWSRVALCHCLRPSVINQHILIRPMRNRESLRQVFREGCDIGSAAIRRPETPAHVRSVTLAYRTGTYQRVIHRAADTRVFVSF